MRIRRKSAPLLLVLAAAACGGESEAHDLEAMAQESLSQVEGELAIPGLQAPVEVIRDQWGIPHIYAQNSADLFFAQGFVQAQDRLWQMEMWRRFNGGRLAEVVGPEALRHDRLMRLIQYQGPWDDAEFESYHPQGREIFSSFIAGVNAFIDQNADNLPLEFKLTGIRPEPWTLRDAVLRVPARSLASATAELRFALQVKELGAEEANRRARHDPVVPLHVADGVDFSLITDAVLDALQGSLPTVPFPRPPLLPEFRSIEGAVASVDFGAPENSPGSNNWVVGPSRSATGEVILANDPHRQVTNPSLRYIVHLNAEGWDVIGATEPAIPGVAIGHNGRVAWGLTIVGTDYDDVFVERLNPDNLDEAAWQGGWYPLTVRVDTIPVLGQDPVVVEHRYSRNGPIFYVDSTNAVAYALRSTLQEPGTAEYLGALRLNQAGLTPTCREFLQFQTYYKAPSENMICGDEQGNIAWSASALTPRRVGGWYGRLPVPGDGAYRWDGFRNDLPTELNPSRGWIATANHNIHPEGYTPPLFFKQKPYSRWDRLQQIFAERSSFTPEDFEAMMADAQWPYFEEERMLLEGWTSSDEGVEWARARLLEWNGWYDRSLAAPAIHNVWLSEIDPSFRDAGVPDAERVRMAQEALEAAVPRLAAELGADRAGWRWGRMHTSRFPHWLVSAFDLEAVERHGGGGTVAATGATYREIIDFSNLDNSRVTSTPGQSGQPGSPFYDNLRPLWADFEFFPLRYTRSAVDQNARYRLLLQPGG